MKNNIKMKIGKILTVIILATFCKNDLYDDLVNVFNTDGNYKKAKNKDNLSFSNGYFLLIYMHKQINEQSYLVFKLYVGK